VNRVRSNPPGRPALAAVAGLFLVLSAATSSAQPFQPVGDVAVDDGQPNAGRLSWVAPVPLSGGAKILVASSDGGVWRTLDGGATWDTKTDQMPSLRVSALAVNNDGERVFAATWKPTRLLRSLDGGDNFTELTIPELAHDRDRIWQLIVDAAHADTVYATTTRGLMRSTNNGTDWSVVFSPDTHHVRYATVMAGSQFWVLATRGECCTVRPLATPVRLCRCRFPPPRMGSRRLVGVPDA